MKKSIKSTLKVSLEEAFKIGKVEGFKEAFIEIDEMSKRGWKPEEIRSYIQGRLKTVQNSDNPFKQKD